jgi:hypothetical protein
MTGTGRCSGRSITPEGQCWWVVTGMAGFSLHARYRCSPSLTAHRRLHTLLPWPPLQPLRYLLRRNGLQQSVIFNVVIHVLVWPARHLPWLFPVPAPAVFTHPPARPGCSDGTICMCASLLWFAIKRSVRQKTGVPTCIPRCTPSFNTLPGYRVAQGSRARNACYGV